MTKILNFNKRTINWKGDEKEYQVLPVRQGYHQVIMDDKVVGEIIAHGYTREGYIWNIKGMGTTHQKLSRVAEIVACKYLETGEVVGKFYRISRYGGFSVERILDQSKIAKVGERVKLGNLKLDKMKFLKEKYGLVAEDTYQVEGVVTFDLDGHDDPEAQADYVVRTGRFHREVLPHHFFERIAA